MRCHLRVSGPLLLVFFAVQPADAEHWELHERSRSAGTIRGAAMAGTAVVYTWGDVLEEWRLPQGMPRRLAHGPFGEGGCTFDVNRDGQPDVIVQREDPARSLVWLEARTWRQHTIDTGTEVHDAIAATLFGRRGVLAVHRYGQVRFYQAPNRSLDPWPYREIYSFYTASRQGGLLLSDVDHDGRADILCGNYWIRSPERFALPWRLFTINTYSEAPEAAILRLALAKLPSPGEVALVAAERERSPARLAWFRPPPNPRDLWIERRLDGRLDLVQPRGLAVADFDSDGHTDIAVAEHHGAKSRLLLFLNRGRDNFFLQEAFRGKAVIALWAADLNRDGRPDLLAAGPNGVFWWQNPAYRRK